jgi:hypothetical protein
LSTLSGESAQVKLMASEMIAFAGGGPGYVELPRMKD